MRLRAATGAFYPNVALLTFADNMMFTAVLWLSIVATGSSLLLGVVLCLSVLLPFALERLAGGLMGWLTPRRLLLLRSIAFAAVLLLFILGALRSVPGFLAAGLLAGVADYLTATTLETLNIKYSLAGEVTADDGARYIQLAVQVGGFAGAAVAGICVSSFGLPALAWLAGFALLANAGLYVLKPPVVPELSETSAGPAKARMGPSPAIYLFAALAIVGFHIGALNSMLPVVYQLLHGWSAARYGLASGLAGIGAFIGAIAFIRSGFGWFPPLLLLADAVLVLCPFPVVSIASAFFIGLSTNHLRIVLRTAIMKLARSEQDARWLGERSAYFALSATASAPVLLTLLTSQSAFSPARAPALLIAAGFGSFLCIPLYRRSQRRLEEDFGADRAAAHSKV